MQLLKMPIKRNRRNSGPPNSFEFFCFWSFYLSFKSAYLLFCCFYRLWGTFSWLEKLVIFTYFHHNSLANGLAIIVVEADMLCNIAYFSILGLIIILHLQNRLIQHKKKVKTTQIRSVWWRFFLYCCKNTSFCSSCLGFTSSWKYWSRGVFSFSATV